MTYPDPVPALTVAQQFLWYAHSHERFLTTMQVLKLVYISHGWMLGLVGCPLIQERVEAWRYGPAIRSVYRQYRGYRGNPIRDVGKNSSEELHEHQASIIRQTFDIYGQMSGIRLSRRTHQEGSPWSKTWKAGLRYVPNELIKDYYQERARKAAAESGE